MIPAYASAAALLYVACVMDAWRSQNYCVHGGCTRGNGVEPMIAATKRNILYR
jgi:hypothetical protein